MRLSEKTIELTFCHQFRSYLAQDLIWFGLTQRQEARAGFDACTRLNGRLIILQFKASSQTTRNRSRRFRCNHDQMITLQNLCKKARAIFYVFPLIGTTLELSNNPSILNNTWLLDVTDLENPMPLPLKNNGLVRINRIHYVDVLPGVATIHSEPFNASLLKSIHLAENLNSGNNFGLKFENYNEFEKLRKSLHRRSVAVIVM